MSSNESNIFEENNLYIHGRTLRNSIQLIKSEFDQLCLSTIEKYNDMADISNDDLK